MFLVRIPLTGENYCAQRVHQFHNPLGRHPGHPLPAHPGHRAPAHLLELVPAIRSSNTAVSPPTSMVSPRQERLELMPMPPWTTCSAPNRPAKSSISLRICACRAATSPSTTEREIGHMLDVKIVADAFKTVLWLLIHHRRRRSDPAPGLAPTAVTMAPKRSKMAGC